MVLVEIDVGLVLRPAKLGRDLPLSRRLVVQSKADVVLDILAQLQEGGILLVVTMGLD